MMDPISLKHLAEIRQQEILKAAANDREQKAKPQAMSQLRGWLQNLTTANGQPSKDQSEI